jgi:hypothetical protein
MNNVKPQELLKKLKETVDNQKKLTERLQELKKTKS